MISISIIIPVYNAAPFFHKCLESLFTQTLDNIEYIFVNDRTPDNSMSILEEVLEKYPERKSQIVIIEHEYNSGSGRARYSGMKAAKGEYVIHCDSDDWCDVDMMKKMYHEAKENDADIVCCNFVDENGIYSSICRYEYQEEHISIFKSLRFGVLYSSLCNKLVRRELYEKNQIFPFDGINMWEDLGVTARLRFYSKKTIIINDVLYHYRRSNSNSIVSTPSLQKIEEQMRCAALLCTFFNGQDGDYQLVCNFLKFKSKESLIVHKSIRNMKKWRSIYPESHRQIWKYISIPLNIRFIYWLAIKDFGETASLLLDLKIKIKKMIKK